MENADFLSFTTTKETFVYTYGYCWELRKRLIGTRKKLNKLNMLAIVSSSGTMHMVEKKTQKTLSFQSYCSLKAV